MKRVAIIQPSYIPWRGFFDVIQSVDEFIFLDDVQYTVRDWRNRNRIRLRQGGATWLTIPVLGGRDQRIADVQVDDSQGWRRKHLESLRHNYGKTPFFERFFPALSEQLLAAGTSLSEIDIRLTELVCDWLECRRPFHRSSELSPQGSKDDRLIDLVRKIGGTYYLSGPAAQAYIQPEKFESAGIALAWADYGGYPEYEQIATPFDPFVSVLDLLFAVGPEAPAYIWGTRRQRSG